MSFHDVENCDINSIIEDNIIEDDIIEDDIIEDIIDIYAPDEDLFIKSTYDNKIYYNGEDSLAQLFLSKFNYVLNRDYIININYNADNTNDDNIVNNADNIVNNTANIVNDNIVNDNIVYFMPNDIIDKPKDGKYVILIYGFLLDGTKAELTINGIIPFFDVMVPNYIDNNSFTSLLTNTLMSEVSDSIIEDIWAYPIRGFNKNKVLFKRIYNKTLQTRKKAMTLILAAGWETASDDKNNYHRKVARENNLLLSDWMELRNVVVSNSNYNSNSSAPKLHKMAVDIKNIKTISNETKQSNRLFVKDRTLVMTWDIETYSNRNMGDLPLSDYDEDNIFMICMTVHWKDDAKPLAQICITDHECDSDDRWTTIICGENSKDSSITYINIIKAFALCFEMFRPDILCGFNDGDYDWPFLIGKAKKFSILEWVWNKMSISYQYINYSNIISFYGVNKQQIKITGAGINVYCSYLKIIGCIMIDVRVCFRKLYPKAERTSLKYFLEICNLGGKADMPMKKMWQFYKNAGLNQATELNIQGGVALQGPQSVSPSEGMRHIANYCVIDALRCQELLLKRDIINDLREITSLAYMTLYDAHYYANGKRVCNLLGAYANRKNILISMIAKPHLEEGKYPGAFVFPPDKGLTPNPINMKKIEDIAEKIRQLKIIENIESECELNKAYDDFKKDRPTVGLDFSSLYPSLIMTYNLSPEKIIRDEKTSNNFKNDGYNIHNIDFQYNDRQIKAYSIMHNNNESDIGLYPTVLIDLFNKRAEVKKILAKYKSIKEVMDGIFGLAKKVAINNNDPLHQNYIKDSIYNMRNETINELATLSSIKDDEIIVSAGSTLEEEIEDNKRKTKNIKEKLSILDTLLEMTYYDDDKCISYFNQYYDNALFECNSANSKQNAIKVYMNSFYGEAGNPLSPFFLLELAGGVTSSGQYNIKLVAKFVTEEKGFFIKYGDTDSLYLVSPAKYFTECDLQFVNGQLTREEYWSAMVRITMRVMNGLKNEVNDCLYKDNGSRYLKMAYEEVLYPVVFTGKKKYYGIAHENEVNFRPNNLFIRGIDIIKQGQSGLAKIIGNRIMWESMSINNNKTVRQIVEDVIADSVNNKSQWEFEHFIKSAAWRPNKKNISVHVFMNRMRIYFDIENSENQKRLALGQNTKEPLYELPESGERFNYVLVKKDSASDMFDTKGRKKTIKVGDKMEFINVAKHNNLPIDIAFYMKSYVVGICARFINYDDEFQSNDDTLDDKKNDEYTQKMAKKYLENFIKLLENIDSATVRQMGNLYKKAFSTSIKKTKEILHPYLIYIFHGKFINYEHILQQDSLYEIINSNIVQYIEKKYTPVLNLFCNKYIKYMNIMDCNGVINSKKLYKCATIINNLYNKDKKINNISNDFQLYINPLNIITIKYENILEKNVQIERAIQAGIDLNNSNDEFINFIDIISNDEKELLLNFRKFLLKLFSKNMNTIRFNTLMKHIETLKNLINKSDIKPTIIEIKKSIKISANEFYPICGNVKL
jgi:DNA polymerase elongation subunit (family B)